MCGRNIIAIGSCDRLDDLILLSNAHALQQALSDYLRFCVSVWTGENDSNTLRVDANFFKNGGKNLRSQKYPHTCGQGLIRPSKTSVFACRKRRLRVDATPKRRKKPPFSKISAYVWLNGFSIFVERFSSYTLCILCQKNRANSETYFITVIDC